MSSVNPIPSGSALHSQWQFNRRYLAPDLPTSWTATVLLSPFGDSIAPLKNYSQLVVGTIEASSTPDGSWLRARLYLTQDETYFDFVFTTERCDGIDKYQWYWI